MSGPSSAGSDTAAADIAPPPDGSVNRNPAGMSLLALVREDFVTHGSDAFSQGFWAVFWHRYGNWRMGLPKLARVPATVLYRVMFKLCEWVCGISIPYSIPLGRRVRIEHFGGVVISALRIGDDVVIRQNTTMGIVSVERPLERPVIGDRVDIGAGAVIVGPVTVGDDVRIGANAVVVRDVPPGCVAAGVPARIVRCPDGGRLGTASGSASGAAPEQT